MLLVLKTRYSCAVRDADGKRWLCPFFFLSDYLEAARSGGQTRWAASHCGRRTKDKDIKDLWQRSAAPGKQ